MLSVGGVKLNAYDVMKQWKILRTDSAFDNKWCKVQRHTVELPTGKILDDYYVNVRPDVVLIFPITSDGNVIMVRQYKHGVMETLLEFPGGVIDSQEEHPITAAERELREETGYFSSRMEELSFVYDNPTKDTNKIFFFLAQDVEKIHDTEFDSTEDIETVKIQISEIPELIKNQKITVAGSIALYFTALMHLNLGA